MIPTYVENIFRHTAYPKLFFQLTLKYEHQCAVSWIYCLSTWPFVNLSLCKYTACDKCGDPLRTGLQAWVGWLYKHIVWADTLTIHNLSLWLNYLQTVEGCWGAPIWQGWRTLSVPACSEVVCRVGKYQHQCVFRWICWRMLQVLNLASMSSGASVEGCCRFPNSQVCLRVGCLHDWLQDMHKVTVCVCDT